MDWRKLSLLARFLIAVPVVLAGWGCNGAPEPKVNKSTRDAAAVDTDAIAVGIDANQPSSEVKSEANDDSLEEDLDAGNGKD